MIDKKSLYDDLEPNIRESKTQAEKLLQVALKEALEPKKSHKLTVSK